MIKSPKSFVTLSFSASRNFLKHIDLLAFLLSVSSAMASVHKRSGAKYFYAAFTDSEGIRRFVSTHELKRDAALKVANAWQEIARKAKTREQFNKIANELHQQIFNETSAACSLADYATRWLASSERETAISTASNYKSAVGKFQKFMEKRDKWRVDLREMSLEHLTEFRDELASSLSGRRTNNILKIVGIMLRRAWNDSLMTEDIASKVRTVRQERPIRRDLSADEIRALLANASNEWRGLVACGLYTGLRLGDIVRLRWVNIDLTAGEIRTIANKTDTPIVAPIAAPLKTYFEDLPASDDAQAFVFSRAASLVARSKGRVAALSAEFHGLLSDAAIIKPRVDDHKAHKNGRAGRRHRSPVSFHSLRHSFVSLLKNAGASQLVAQSLAGHSSAAISQIYSHAGADSARKAVATLPDIFTKAPGKEAS